VLLLLVVTSLVIGCSKQEEKATQPANEDIKEEINTIDVFGEIKTKQEKNIRLELNARVAKVAVETGDLVAQNDKLLTLDLTKAKGKLAHKRNSLQAAKNKLEKIERGGEINFEQLKNQLRTEEKLEEVTTKKLTETRSELTKQSSPDLKKLASKLKTEKELYQQKKEELAQQKKLLNKEVIAQHEFDQFKQSVARQKQVVENLKLGLAETKYNKKQEIKNLKTELINHKQVIKDLKLKLNEHKYQQQHNYLAQEVEVKQLTREINQLETELNKSFLEDNQIISDIQEGVVSDIGYKEGDIITEEKKIISIIDLDDLVVEVDIPEEFIKDVKLGASATIIPLANRDKKYQGKVIKIDNRALERGGETVIPAEISIDNKDEFLRPNFNVDVKIKRKEG
jgi:multidrug resistance efflux pump